MKRKTTKEDQLNSLTINYIKKEVIDKLNDITFDFEGKVNSEENRYFLKESIVQYLNDEYPRFSNYIDVKVEEYKHNRSIINIKFVEEYKHNRNIANIKFIDKETLEEDYLENLIKKYYGCATLTIKI